MNVEAANQKQQNIQLLLPKCLEMIGNETKSAELRVVYDAPTNQATYRYSIVWEDANPDGEEKYRVAISEANKIMMALKAKKLNKSFGQNGGKNVSSGKTLEDQMIEKQEQGVQFPPDLRSRSEQREKEPESTHSVLTASDSDVSTGSLGSESTNSVNSENKIRKSTRSNVEDLPLNLNPVGCLNDQQMVPVKVFVIEKEHFRGKLRPVSITKATLSKNIKTVLMDVLRENFDGIPTEKLIHKGSVLFAFHDKNNAQKVRRIRQDDVDRVIISNLAKLRGDVVLILDLVGFITKGKKIPLQIDIDQ
ncbi:unnamed protein product [Caenorhabditis brenneri]